MRGRRRLRKVFGQKNKEQKTEERPRLQTETEEESFGKMKDECRKLEPSPLATIPPELPITAYESPPREITVS